MLWGVNYTDEISKILCYDTDALGCQLYVDNTINSDLYRLISDDDFFKTRQACRTYADSTEITRIMDVIGTFMYVDKEQLVPEWEFETFIASRIHYIILSKYSPTPKGVIIIDKKNRRRIVIINNDVWTATERIN